MYELIIHSSPKHKKQWTTLPVPELYLTLFFVFQRMHRIQKKHTDLKFKFEIREVEYGN